MSWIPRMLLLLLLLQPLQRGRRRTAVDVGQLQKPVGRGGQTAGEAEVG